MEFLKASFILYITSITLAFGGLVFWFIASQLIALEEIGYATTAISTVFLISSFSSLGLEYTLLKRTSADKGKLVGTLFVFEIFVIASLLPLVFLFSNPFESSFVISILAIMIFLTSGLAFIPKSAMLGMMDAKIVALYDVIAFSARLITLIVLALLELGYVAILSALFIHSAILSIAFGITCYKKIGFSLGGFSYLKTILKEGLNNFPMRLSRLIIMNLGIVLFAYISLEPKLVAILYIAITISIVGSEFATTLSTMSLPASVTKGKQIISYSTQLSLVLSVPIIVILISAPGAILGLIGEDYSAGETTLFILALAIIPTALVLNGLAKFNSEGKFRMAAIMGLIEIIAFFILVFPLTILYSIDGVAIAILISSLASGIYAGIAFGKYVIKITLIVSLAVFLGYVCSILVDYVYPIVILKILISSVVSFTFLLILKTITISEIKMIYLQLFKEK